MNAYEIPASQLRQFIFCKRIPYITLALGIKSQSPPWTKIGISWHKERFKKEKRRQIEAYGMQNAKIMFEVPLSDASLNLTGKADIILEGINHIAVVECKSGKPNITKGLMLQTYAYKIMAEKIFNKPCKNCFLVSRKQRKMKEIIFSDNFYNKFLKTLNDIQTMLTLETMPEQTPSQAKCLQCEFINWCGDRL